MSETPFTKDSMSGAEAKRRVEDAPRKLHSAIKVMRLIAEMPASTHAIDKELCLEWLRENT